jgi:hypothetical protein
MAGAAGFVLVLAGCVAGHGTSGHAPESAHPATPQEVLEKAVKRLGAVTTYQASVSVATAAHGRKNEVYGELSSRSKPDRALEFHVEDALSTHVLLGDRWYVRDLALLQVSHKPWISLSLSKAADRGVPRVAAWIHQPDPLLNTKMFTSSKDVRALGAEAAGGTSATHYQGTVALSEALTRLDATERAQAREVYGPAGAHLNFDVWIDAGQLVRKISVVTPPGTKRRLHAIMNYSTFDTPVTITAPPPGQVKDATDREAMHTLISLTLPSYG